MKKLVDDILAYSASIGNSWEQKPGLTARNAQERYLYVSAFGAVQTTVSYWTLRDAGRAHDCQILARTLFERILNSRIAAQSPEDAVGLMCHELSERIRRLKLWPSDQPEIKAELERKLKEQDDELNQFLPLAGLTEPPRWDVLAKAKEVGLESIYRTAYWHLSRYIHPGYDMSRPEEFDTIPESSDFIALLSPIDTAAQLHRVVDDCSGCDSEKSYVQLFERIALATIRKGEV